MFCETNVDTLLATILAISLGTVFVWRELSAQRQEREDQRR